MSALLVVHDVDDVDHWLKSPKREELMGPRGFTVRTFVDPADPTRVGLVVEGATLQDFEDMLKSESTAEAMQYDGVRPDTLRVLEER
jgi:hypothetical protein